MRTAVLAAVVGAALVAGLTAPVRLTAGGQAVPAPPAPPSVPGSLMQGEAARGTGLIVGQVVDGTTGKPVGGALVTLNMTVTVNRGQGAAPPGLTTTTTTTSDGRGGVQSFTQVNLPASTGRVLADGEGRFMFHDLPAGSGNLTATAPGYNSGSFGAQHPNEPSRPIRLAAGERMSTATVRLWKLCTIAGTITDEAGEPLVNVQVSALRFSTSSGTRRTDGGPTTQTDDRGAYHFLLQSGDYLLVVPATSTSVPVASIDLFQQAMNNAGQSMTDMMRALSESGAPSMFTSGARVGNAEFLTTGGIGRNSPPPPAQGAPLLAYQTTFFPNATSVAQADTISLDPGEDRLNVDLMMRLATTVRVTGSLVGPDGTGANLGLRLVAADSKDAQFNSNYPTASTLSDATGAFTFLGVPSGQYELQVTRIARPQVVPNPSGAPTTVTPNTPTLWARVPVSVGPTDVDGLLVSLRTGLRISGRIEFDGASPRPPADRLASMRIMINDVDGNGQVFPATVGADGTFTTQGLVPGRLMAMFQGSPGPKWVLKSVMANNHDISAGPQPIDGDVTNAIVTFTDHPNELSGTVQGLASAAPAPGVGPNVNPVIVIFPANYQAWLAGGTNGRQSRTIRIGQTAQFTTTALPAGEYDVAAIPAELVGTWQEPKTLEIIARGATHVTMGDDDHRTVDVRPLTIR